MKINGMNEIVRVYEENLIKMVMELALKYHNNEENGLLDKKSLKAFNWGWTENELTVFLDGDIKYDGVWYPYQHEAYVVPGLDTGYWYVV